MLCPHLVQHAAIGYTEAHSSPVFSGLGTCLESLRWPWVGVIVGVGWWVQRRRVDPTTVSLNAALHQSVPGLPLLARVTDAVLQIIAVDVGGSLGHEGARQTGAALDE